MAAFSYQNQHLQHPPSLLDLSVFFPSSPIKMSTLLQEEHLNNISSCFPHSSPSQHFQQRTDSSSIVVDLEGSSEDQATQVVTPMDNKRKTGDGSCLSSAESKDPKKARVTKRRNNSFKETETKKSKDDKKIQKKDSETTPSSGYVHVRARRGEATDSHSLAERVRRERISERLKLLQSLVPGCDKVTSKALMLDEIINYVQSLQHQVEFLSMKLASTSPMVYDLAGIDMNSIVKQEILSNMPLPLPAVQHPLLNASPSVVSDITAPFTTANNYPLTDNSISYLLQQGGPRPSVSYQDNVNLFWGGDEQRQRFFNQSDFNSLCSFQ